MNRENGIEERIAMFELIEKIPISGSGEKEVDIEDYIYNYLEKLEKKYNQRVLRENINFFIDLSERSVKIFKGSEDNIPSKRRDKYIKVEDNIRKIKFHYQDGSFNVTYGQPKFVT